MSDSDPLLSRSSASVAGPPTATGPTPSGRDPSTRWEPRGELGWGGMGRVILAWDHWLGRHVAIKEPITLGDVARFEREALLMAQLEHPGIVPIFDVGTSPEGRPWFAMRVVRGRSLASILDAQPGPTERVGLLRSLLAACEAVAFAHDRGIVHRDLKPSNLMLGAFGESQVIDWGLALAPGFAEVAPTPEASDAARGPAGTPRYMSPEQARGEPVGPASDVFALGAILFEIAAGRRAFDGPDAAAVTAEIAAGRVPGLRDAAPDASPELGAIVARAMAPRVADRYPTAKALADDLARYLDGRRVAAHSYSTLALLLRVARAWRAPLIVAALGLVALGIVSIVAFLGIAAERDKAQQQLGRALALAADSAAQSGARAEAEVLAAEALEHAPLPSARGVLAALAGPRPTHETLATLPCRPVDVFGERVLCRTETGLGVAERGVLLWDAPLIPDHGAVFIDEGRAVLISSPCQVFDASTGAALTAEEVTTCGAPVRRTADGRAAIAQGAQCAMVVDRTSTRSLSASLCGEGGLEAFTVHPDGRRWAMICRGGAVVLGALESMATTREMLGTHDGTVTAVSFAGPGVELFVGTSSGQVLHFDPASAMTTVLDQRTGLVHRIEVDPAQMRALIVRDLGAAEVMDVRDHTSLGRLPTRDKAVVTFDRDGTILVAEKLLERWDFSAVRPSRVQLAGGISALDVSPDGRSLAVGHGPWLSLVDPVARRVIDRVTWQTEHVKDVAFHPRSGLVSAHGMASLTIEGFSTAAGLTRASSLPTQLLRRIGVLADGSFIGATYGRGLFVYRAGAERAQIGTASMRDLVVSRDGLLVAGIGEDRHIYKGQNLHAGGAFEPCGDASGVRAVALDPLDGSVWGARHESIDLMCGDRPVGPSYRADGAELLSLAIAPRWVAAGAHDGTVRLWRRDETEVYVASRSHAGRASALAFDPGEGWLVTGGWDGAVAFLTLPPPEHVDARALEAAWGLDLRSAFGVSADPAAKLQ